MYKRLLKLLPIFILALVQVSCTNKQSNDTPMLYAWMICTGRVTNAYYYTDVYGRSVSEKKFSFAAQFTPNGLACVQEYREDGRGKWGFIDKTLNPVIPYRYDYAGSFGAFGFAENLACVKFDLDEDNLERIPSVACGPAMLIDENGCQASKIYGYMLLGPDNNGLTEVNSGTKFGSTKGYYGFSYDGKWGAIDRNGKEVIPCIYEFLISHWYTDNYIVRLNGKWGLIRFDGKALIECEHDGVVYNRSGEVEINTFSEVDGDEYNKWTDIIETQDILFITNGEIKKRVKPNRPPVEHKL